MLQFESLPAYLQQSLKAKKKWPIPDPHPDQIIMAFLAEFDVNVKPADLPGFDGVDLVVGFLSDFEYAQLNSINRNQAKQSQRQEWTSWKQWALSHSDFPGYRENLLSSIHQENAARLEWLNSLDGQDFIAAKTKEQEQQVKVIRTGVVAVALLGVSGFAIVTVIGLVGSGINLVGDIASILLPKKEAPEPKAVNQSRYMWLARKCIDLQQERLLPPSSGKRDYCKDMHVVIEQLQQRRSDNEEQGNAGNALLADQCKIYIGDVMGRDPDSMSTDYSNSGSGTVGISYLRADDGKKFKYECKVSGGNIVWRGVDIFAPGEGPGRWRNEDSRPVSSL